MVGRTLRTRWNLRKAGSWRIAPVAGAKKAHGSASCGSKAPRAGSPRKNRRGLLGRSAAVAHGDFPLGNYPAKGFPPPGGKSVRTEPGRQALQTRHCKSNRPQVLVEWARAAMVFAASGQPPRIRRAHAFPCFFFCWRCWPRPGQRARHQEISQPQAV